LAVGLLVLGCSYSFSGSSLPSHVKTIAIPTVENETLEPGLSQEVTTGLIDAFVKDGRLKLASERQANSRLEARITGYESKVRNYDAGQNPVDYIVVLTMSLALRDQVKSRELWRDDAIQRTAVYVPGGATGGAGTEIEARAEAIAALATDVVGRTMEQW